MVGTDEKGNSLSYDETVRRLIGREQIDRTRRNVLVSHQFYLPSGRNAEEMERMDSEIRTVGNIDEVSADILEQFDYAALGHIHKPMKAGGERWRYCGTPLACSVSEAGQQKEIVMVDMGEKGDVRISAIPAAPAPAGARDPWNSGRGAPGSLRRLCDRDPHGPGRSEYSGHAGPGEKGVPETSGDQERDAETDRLQQPDPRPKQRWIPSRCAVLF